MTAYVTPLYAANTPAGTGHGLLRTSTHLHAVSGTLSTWAAGDTLSVGWLPANAVVSAVVLKTGGQLDASGAPTLAFDVGTIASPQLFKAAITSVGRLAGASVDNTVAAAGYLFKTPARTAVVLSVHTGAATPVAGSVEADIAYYVEDASGSNP